MPRVGKRLPNPIKKKILYQWWGPKGTFQKQPVVQRTDKIHGLSVVENGQPSKTTRPIAEETESLGIHVGLNIDEEIELAQSIKVGTAEIGPGKLFHKDQSPPYSFRYDCGSGKDPMLAVGHSYVIVTHASYIRFFNRQGNLLEMPQGLPNQMSAKEFFGAFVTWTNPDGSWNLDNINLNLNIPDDAPVECVPNAALPVSCTNNNGLPCVVEFYDVRVHYDPFHRRFFLMSHSRNCIQETSKDLNPNGIYDGLGRRYVAFAVSKSEDPRDGFHQYMVTQSNRRDWPRFTVSGDHFVITWDGVQLSSGPVARVFSVKALKEGNPDPPNFSYFKNQIGGSGIVYPVTSFGDTNDMTFLLKSVDKMIWIYAFSFAFSGSKGALPPPPLQVASIELEEPLPKSQSGGGFIPTNAIYRDGKIYFTCNKLMETYPLLPNGWRLTNRFDIRVVRLPIKKKSANVLEISKNKSEGFLDHNFGGNALSDAPGDLVSYERPSIAVNKHGDICIGYGRIGVVTKEPLLPEARYSIWYHNEEKQRRSNLLHAGEHQPSKDGKWKFFNVLDYQTVVVDPADDESFWMALGYGASNNSFKTIVGKVEP